MTIFSRFRDIVSSNINSLLDKAEDPEKLLKLMIREMEDTLVEMKASCAGAMASRSKVERHTHDAVEHATRWNDKATLALEKGREDLAREALLEKRSFQEKVDALEIEHKQHDDLVEQYKKDILELENKLEQARNQYRMLIQRHIHAHKKKKAQSEIRSIKSSETILKFERFENRIERMEAEADLVNPKVKATLEEELTQLEADDELEKELAELKKNISSQTKKD